MDPRSFAFSTEELLAHADWVRELARRLVSDPSSAEDLAQDSLARAIESPPRERSDLRSWFRALVRNRARDIGRSQSSRVALEKGSAKHEALEATDELVAKAELQRELTGEVLALDEPYRSVVLMRWYEGLAPRDIARKTGRPVETVKTQLARAHAELRTRLDRRHGDRERWLAAYGTLADVLGTTTTIGVVAGLGWKLAIVLVAIGGTWWVIDQPTSRRVLFSDSNGFSWSASDELASIPKVEQRVPAKQGVIPEVAASANGAPISSAPSSTLGTFHLEGRVVDLHGQPIGGLALVAHDPDLPHFEAGVLRYGSASVGVSAEGVALLHQDPTQVEPFMKATHTQGIPGVREALLGTDCTARTRTAADGSYQLDVPGHAGDVSIDDPRLVLLADAVCAPRHEQVLIAAPAIELGGVVRDSLGGPIADAEVYVPDHLESLPDFPLEIESANIVRSFQMRTNREGRFHFDRLPFTPQAVIDVTHEGFDGNGTFIPAEGSSELVIVMRTSAVLPKLRGLVLDADGNPAADVSVKFGQDGGATDASGRFAISLTSFDERTSLIAVRRGFGAAVVEGIGAELRAHPESNEEHVLRLGGPALEITGHVLDANNQPCLGWYIDPADALMFGNDSISVENMTAFGYGEKHQPRTDAAGAFTLPGLRNQEYRIRALDPRTCLAIVSEPVQPGARDMIIHLPPDALRPLLAGKVVSRHGLPVSGVSVGVIASKSKNIGTESYINGVKTRSDSNGRFELHDVSRRGLKLLVERNGLTTDVINVPDDADSANARLEVTLTYRVKMQQRAGLEVEWLEFVDLAGRVINAEVKYRDAISQDKRFSSYYFETGVFIVPEDAVAVVVYRGKAELERVPLVLNAGELNVVRL